MNRRVSTALALLLTTVAGFIITTYGMHNGLFGGGGDAAAPPQVQASVPVQPAATTPPPQIVEQIVYRDEYVRVAAPADEGGAGTNPSAPGPADEDEDSAPPQAVPAATTPLSQPTAPPANNGTVQAIDLQGTVTAVGDGTFTLGGTSRGTVVISVNSSTGYEGGGFGNLEPGVRVEAKVLAAGGSQPTGPDGTWIAVHVHMED